LDQRPFPWAHGGHYGPFFFWGSHWWKHFKAKSGKVVIGVLDEALAPHQLVFLVWG